MHFLWEYAYLPGEEGGFWEVTAAPLFSPSLCAVLWSRHWLVPLASKEQHIKTLLENKRFHVENEHERRSKICVLEGPQSSVPYRIDSENSENSHFVTLLEHRFSH